jgi:hypothetical protein
MTSDFLTETLKSWRVWNEVFQALKENNFKLGSLHSKILSFIIEREIQNLS